MPAKKKRGKKEGDTVLLRSIQPGIELRNEGDLPFKISFGDDPVPVSRRVAEYLLQKYDFFEEVG